MLRYSADRLSTEISTTFFFCSLPLAFIFLRKTGGLKSSRKSFSDFLDT
jgi:hypothetical protein